MKVLFVSHSSAIGGAENILCHLLNGLATTPVQPIVVLPAAGPLEKKLQKLGVDYYYSEMRWWLGTNIQPPSRHLVNFFSGLTERLERLEGLIKTIGVEAIVTNTSAVAEAAFVAHKLGIPHLWWIHEMLGQDSTLKPPLPFKIFFPLLAALSQQIIVVSKTVYHELIGYCGSQAAVEILYNGIPADPDSPPSYKKDSDERSLNKIVLQAGAISERKGTLSLLLAARRVCNAVPDAVFWIAGEPVDPVYYQKILAQRSTLGLEDRFLFLGFREDIDALLHQSRLLALPSDSDPFPTILLEAMRASRPLVATRSGGAEEIIREGENGFLVPVNDPDQMAERIILLLQNDPLALKMGQRGHEIFKQRYSLDRFTRDFQNILGKATSIPTAKNQSPFTYLAGLTDLFLKLGNEFEAIQERHQQAMVQMQTRHQQAMVQMQTRHGREIDQVTHDFQSSRSWKITQPLRWLSRKSKTS